MPVREPNSSFTTIDGANLRTIFSIMLVSRLEGECTSAEMLVATYIWRQSLDEVIQDPWEEHRRCHDKPANRSQTETTLMSKSSGQNYPRWHAQEHPRSFMKTTAILYVSLLGWARRSTLMALTNCTSW